MSIELELFTNQQQIINYWDTVPTMNALKKTKKEKSTINYGHTGSS